MSMVAALAHRQAAAARDARRCCIIVAAITFALYVPIAGALITLTP